MTSEERDIAEKIAVRIEQLNAEKSVVDALRCLVRAGLPEEEALSIAKRLNT